MLRSSAYFLPAIGWAVIIYSLSTNTMVINGPFDWLDFISIDKIGHLVFYSILSVMLQWGFYKAIGIHQSLPSRYIWISIIVANIFGIIMEYLQYKYYPNRFFDIADMLANALGIFIGVFLFRYGRKYI